MPHTERRRAIRFELHLPIIVRWGSGSEKREIITVSEDLSSNGIYFFLPEGIEGGTIVEVEMTLPNEITLAEPVRVRCSGRVQRCQLEKDAKAGVAAAIDKYEFLPNSSTNLSPEQTLP